MLAPRIAIIDNEVDVVSLFQEALELAGFKVCPFTDPLEALNHIKQNPKDYSLIISDYKMPKLDGNELCTELISINPDLKIILMSAFEQIDYDHTRFQFISKPILLSRLIKIVNDTIG
jgi:two-component system cell cycle sensor histidine kinase/response regulator CckA